MEDSESLDDAVTDFFHKNQDPNYLIASSAEGVIQGKVLIFWEGHKILSNIPLASFDIRKLCQKQSH